MNIKRRVNVRCEHHLAFFSLIAAVGALAYLPSLPGSLLPDALAVVIPLGVSLGIGLFTVRMKQRHPDPARLRPMVRYGWAGTFLSAVISGWMIALHYLNDTPVGGTTSQVPIIVSVGLGAGVLLGHTAVRTTPEESSPDTRTRDERTLLAPARERAVAERRWEGRSGPDSISEAVIYALADAESVDPVELAPLTEQVDPEVFSTLQAQDGTQWQFLFESGAYEVRVSGFGIVTVYESSSPEQAEDR